MMYEGYYNKVSSQKHFLDIPVHMTNAFVTWLMCSWLTKHFTTPGFLKGDISYKHSECMLNFQYHYVVLFAWRWICMVLDNVIAADYRFIPKVQSPIIELEEH